MSNRLLDVILAELIKLRSLPAVALTATATIVATVALSLVLAAHTPAAGPTEITGRAVVYTQAGFILIGVLAVATEYRGHQIHTSLLSVPGRTLLLAGKVAAYLILATATSLIAAYAATIAASHATAPSGTPGSPLGVAAYLTLIGLYALLATVAIRHVEASLAGLLTLVLIASPLLRSLTRLTEYLPDRAAATLLLPDTSGVPHLVGAAVAGWIAAVATIAALALALRDA